jgi:hypothetical protein
MLKLKSARHRQFVLPLVGAAMLMSPIIAEAGFGAPPPQQSNLRFDFALGLQNWSEAGDIRNNAGDFDSGGFGFELNLHTAGRAYQSPTLLWGGTLGVAGYDSNIQGLFSPFSDDLQLSMVYITPSVKWIVRDTRDTRIYLDLGAGYYAVSIDEYDNYCYYWGCGSINYYDDDAFGGFVGLSADFDIGRPGGAHLTTGIKAHFVDFDAPFEIASPSALDGTIVQFQVGIATR